MSIPKFSFFLFVLFLFYSCGDPEKKELSNANILFILADDQSFNTIAELGNEEVRTPSLDELARTGTVFTSVYNMGGWNGAVCIASRTMFNTGRFLWNAHEVDQKLDSLANAGQLWSQLMQANGYDTYMTGKWHVKINPEKIFTTVGTKRPGMPGDTPEGYNRPLSMDDWEWTPWDSAYGGFWEGGTHWSELVANETITFLDSASVSTKPFFMYIAFNAPHDPRQSPKKYVDMYPLEAISVPVNFMSEYPYKEKIGCGWSLRDERLAPMPRSEYSVKVNRQEYYAIITHMDHQIGRIIEHLEKTGQKENTYIFFTADHGLACGNHGLMGKQNMYEHSLKPPMIIVGPDIPKGEKRDVNVYLQDIMPTVLDYAGTEIPDYIEFSSLKEMIDDIKTESTYPGIYGAYKNHQRMIRMNRYKLIAYPFEGVLRLFDLEKDPMEMNDLATIPKYQNKVDSMYFALRKLQREMNDTLQLDNFTFSQLSH